MSPDLINGIYECVGGFFVFLSVLKTYRNKSAAGISLWTCLFFTTWGYWNLYFYPSVGATISAYGAIGVAVVNTTWLSLIWKYR